MHKIPNILILLFFDAFSGFELNFPKKVSFRIRKKIEKLSLKFENPK